MNREANRKLRKLSPFAEMARNLPIVSRPLNYPVMSNNAGPYQTPISLKVLITTAADDDSFFNFQRK